MHKDVKDKLNRFNDLFIKSANGRLNGPEVKEFLALQAALRRIGYSGKTQVEIPKND